MAAAARVHRGLHVSRWQTLCIIFVSWKALLFLVALLSPGSGYDTSTVLAEATAIVESGRLSGEAPVRPLQDLTQRLAIKLNRWDAIYFTTAARRGYIFEQEWAFGWGMSSFIAKVTQELQHLGLTFPAHGEIIVGITISNASHFLSVLVLYSLAKSIVVPLNRAIKTGSEEGSSDMILSKENIGFLAACFHIFAPGGLFLSAPYAESSFALLSFCGLRLLAPRIGIPGTGLRDDLLIIIAGVFFGLSSTLRSNGLLHGIIFAREALAGSQRFVERPCFMTFFHLGAVCLGGLAIALGFFYPQFLAYKQYCSEVAASDAAIWCSSRVPLMYSYIQQHYWNVGFLRYWTVSNLPLFLLAAPMLIVLILTGIWFLRPAEIDSARRDDIEFRPLAFTMAFIQIFLAMMAITNYHVQIITRIASAYPLTYVWLSLAMLRPQFASRRPFQFIAKYLLSFMVMYALVQGSLFASFLPPA